MTTKQTPLNLCSLKCGEATSSGGAQYAEVTASCILMLEMVDDNAGALVKLLVPTLSNNYPDTL